jgi:hypothetical protein
MNSMNIPGFAGEASLYTSTAHCTTMGAGVPAAAAGIRPQLSPECAGIRNHLVDLWRNFERAIRERDYVGVDLYAGNIRFYTTQFAGCR